MSDRDKIIDRIEQLEQKYPGHEGVAVLVKALRSAIYTDFYLSPYFWGWWDNISLDINLLLYGNEDGPEATTP